MSNCSGISTLYIVYYLLITAVGFWNSILLSYVSEDEASVVIRWRLFHNVRTNAAMLGYTSAQLRSIGLVKVRLRRPQHNDVISRIVSLGIRRRPRRGSRAGRKRSNTPRSATGNPVTSQAASPCVVSPSRDTSQPYEVTRDQLIAVRTSPYGQHKHWKLPALLLANVRSLINKLDDLEAAVRLNSSDIICLTETWLSDEVPSEAVNIDGFCLYRKDRNRQGGGVACYVRAEFPCTRLQSFESPGLETLWLLLRSPRMPRWLSHIIIAVIYHPPNGNSHEMTEHITNCADEITRAHPNACILVVGDFNRLRDGPLRNYPLRQVVRGGTRKDSVLDKIYTNIPDWYNSPLIIPQIGQSDHNAVVMHPTGRGVRCDVDHKVEWIRSQNPSDKAMLAYTLLRVNWTQLYQLTSCEEMASLFYSIVLSLMDKYLPLRPRSQNLNDKPWVTEECRRVIRRRQ